MTKTSDIKEYYEQFSENVLLKDFQRMNPRQNAIKDLCDRFIFNGARVLEIGCGVGIIAKHIQRKASRLVAIDISEISIKLAKLYTANSKTEFKALDISEDISEIERFGEFDVILLPDVLEHILKEKNRNIFEKIERLLASNGLALITFPSPQYQEYLKMHKPSALQVVDETLKLSDILAATSLEPLYLNYIHIDGKNQYIHLVLRAVIDYVPEYPRLNIMKRVIRKFRKTRWSLNNRAFLRKVKNVLPKK